MAGKRKPRELNPYDWRGETRHFVGRKALLARAIEASAGGEGVFLLLGTRGMGKSAFLARLQSELRLQYPELEILFFSRPPLATGPALVDAILRALLEELLEGARMRGKAASGDPFERRLTALTEKRALRELFEVYLHELAEEVESIVLIYDELDGYAESPAEGRAYFDALEDARKKLERRLVVVAAGGLGMLSLKTILGSSIFARADRKILEPFQEEEIYALAEPFRERGRELHKEVLGTLRVLSGGNLALATYGLQELWDIKGPTPGDVIEAFDRFRDNHNDYCSIVRRAIFGANTAEAPVHVWRKLREAGGRLSRGELAMIRQRQKVESAIETKDILDMLRAGGLIRMDDSAWKADPIVAEIIPSILSFDELASPRSLDTLQEQLRADLVEAMADIHRMTPAFYRPGNKERGEEKQLVPEAVFAAMLVTSLGGRGWRAELEPMSGAGYTDIKARYPTRFGEETGILEVKIWPRHVDTIHDQITSYFAKGVTALATVVIADLKDPAWKDDYKQQCLKGKTDGAPVWKELEPPLTGYFEARWGSHVVEHFLLRLPSRS